jgi:hypothetical protein
MVHVSVTFCPSVFGVTVFCCRTRVNSTAKTIIAIPIKTLKGLRSGTDYY